MSTAPSQRGLARSDAMQEAVRGLEQAIAIGGGVLLHGESGSGRELFARAIHIADEGTHEGRFERVLRLSMKGVPNGRPFVVVDCGASGDLESRLFGTCASSGGEGGTDLDRIHDQSALSSALGGGTLVLRQLSELPARLQARLARVLRDGEVWVERAAENPSLRRVDLRPIGIDERDDEQRIVPELRKRFLRCPIAMPPLRRRREDIPALVKFLVTDFCRSLNVPRKIASHQATQLLAALPWRGNLAELKELLGILVANVPARVIRVSDVLAYTSLDSSSVTFLAGGPLKEACERFEREYVAQVLDRHHGRVADAAKALGIQRTNLYRKLRQLSVQRRDAGRVD